MSYYLIALLLVAGWFGIRWVLDYLKVASLSKNFGCGAVPDAHETLWGLFRLRAIAKADRAGYTVEEFAKMHEEIGCNTWSANWLGSTFMNTVEPENIKAILSSQFQDFEIGHMRRGAMAPLLGETGIFTSDGKAWYAQRMRNLIQPRADRGIGSMLEESYDLNLPEAKSPISLSKKHTFVPC
jgi:hypothetical protein